MDDHVDVSGADVRGVEGPAAVAGVLFDGVEDDCSARVVEELGMGLHASAFKIAPVGVGAATAGAEDVVVGECRWRLVGIG